MHFLGKGRQIGKGLIIALNLQQAVKHLDMV
ncbi:Uncharacterised protein [Mycobacteroides abscessus subsp. abscessus]|nr:Uncharacterised protein [Mycobacteroides abscessus subsp. abscessus]